MDMGKELIYFWVPSHLGMNGDTDLDPNVTKYVFSKPDSWEQPKNNKFNLQLVYILLLWLRRKELVSYIGPSGMTP